jgi:hypothetical protein
MRRTIPPEWKVEHASAECSDNLLRHANRRRAEQRCNPFHIQTVRACLCIGFSYNNTRIRSFRISIARVSDTTRSIPNASFEEREVILLSKGGESRGRLLDGTLGDR